MKLLKKKIYNFNKLKNKNDITIFHEHKYSEEFINKHLEKYPTNLFLLKSQNKSTIFHTQKYSEELISSHFEKYPTNLFELKNKIVEPIIAGRQTLSTIQQNSDWSMIENPYEKK